MKSKPRDAFRRALPNTKTLSSARISIAACFSGRIASLRLRTVSPWPISHVASTRNASFTLAETFAWETGTFRFAFPANAAMRAADECHPLPDQLHPCSPFFRFPRPSPCDAVRSRKDRCVFTTPSIASAGGPVFARENYSFPRPGASSLLSFRRHSSGAGSTFSRGCRFMRRTTKISPFELP